MTSLLVVLALEVLLTHSMQAGPLELLALLGDTDPTGCNDPIDPDLDADADPDVDADADPEGKSEVEVVKEVLGEHDVRSASAPLLLGLQRSPLP